MIVSVVLYKKLGISNSEIALYTSWLYLPWVIKPLWSPLVEILKTNRFWIISMQIESGPRMSESQFQYLHDQENVLLLLAYHYFEDLLYIQLSSDKLNLDLHQKNGFQ